MRLASTTYSFIDEMQMSKIEKGPFKLSRVSRSFARSLSPARKTALHAGILLLLNIELQSFQILEVLE